MAIEVDVVISGTTATAVYDKATTAIITTNLQEDKLATKGGIITGPITPSTTDTIDLGSATKRFNAIYVKDAHLAGSSLHLGEAATISAGAGGGFSFDTDAETVFGDIRVRNLTVTGVQSVIESANLVIKDNIIVVNSGEVGAGITLTSGGLVIDRGTLENATFLFNDNTDKFEFNFPISVDGSELALVPNLIATGQTLQGQITLNDGDIVTLTTNLESTGSTVAANLITSGQTLTTNLASTGTTVAANLVTSGQTLTTNLASTGATVAANLVTSGQTLTSDLASTGDTVAANLVTSGQYLTSEVGTLSGLSVFHSMTGNFATHFTDLDDIFLAGNQGKYLKVNAQGIGLAYDLPPVTGVGGEGGGATHFTGLVDTPNDYSSAGNFPENGGLVVFNSTSEQIAYISSGAFASDVDLILSGNTLDSKRDTLSGNLISTGNALDAARDALSSNVVTTGQTLQTQITDNDSDISTLTTNLITTGQTLQTQVTSNDADIVTLTTNLVSTGNNLESQIVSNDGDISILQTATGTLQDQKFDKMGGTLSGDIVPDASGTISLGAKSLPFKSGYFDDIFVAADSLQIGDDVTISATAEGISFDTTGTTTFGDVSITGDLGVSGDFTLGDSTTDKITTRGDLFVEDDAFFGDAVKVTGNLTVDGTASAAAPTLDTHLTTKLYADTADNTLTTNLAATGSNLQTQVTTDIANLVSTGAIVDDISGNLITSGQTLQTQITNNDSDISTLTSNLVTTGQTLETTTDTISGNLITSGQTLQTQITSNDSDISSLTTNLASTGSTLAVDIVTVSGLTFGNDSDIATITSNLVSTGQTLTTEINTVSGLITSNDGDITALQAATGTLKTSVDANTTNISSNDSDITTLTTNLVSTGAVVDDISGNLISSGNFLDSEIAIVSGIAGAHTDISSLTSNLVTTGQTLQTQITANDGDITSLTTNLASTGSSLDTKIDTLSGVVTLDSETGNLIDTSMTGNFAVNFLDLDDTPSSIGAVAQSVVVNAARDALVFSGVTAGGEGSSTFLGLSDTPVGFTADRLLAVNSGGDAVEFLQSGSLVTDGETGVFATAANLVSTGNNLEGQITSNDSDISTLTSNLGTTGQTLQTQITSNDSDIVTLTSNLITTGQTLTTDVATVSGLITSNDTELSDLRTATGSLQTQVTSNDGDISTLTTNLISTGSIVDDVSGNLITTGQTLQTQITSNDSDISTLTTNLISTGQSVTSEIAIVSGLTTSNDTDIANLTTNLVTTGQTLQTQITSNDSDISTLTSDLATTDGNLITTGQTLQTQITSNDSDISTLDSTTVKLTSDQTIAGNKTFSDTVTITDLNVTGTQTTISTTNLAIKDNLIEINSGETGTGISLISGGITINRGSGESANILFNDSTDQFELNFPIATEGDLVATATNLITTGQTLQTQITSNDGDISTLTSNLSTTDSNLVTTGQTLQTQITSNDSDISTLTSNLSTTDSNLITTGQTLQTQITSNDSDISTLTTNLISTGTIVDDISGNLITSGQTLQTQITSNDGDLSTLTTNLITTGQTLQTQITSNDGDITSLTTNLVTTGQTLQTQITSNDSDISTLTTNLISTGQSITSEIAIVSGLTTSNDTDIATLTTNIGTTGQTLQTQITSNDGDISSLTSNLVTTGQTLQTQITSNDSDVSTLTTNLISTGSTLDTKIDTLSGVVALDSETGHLADTTVLESFSQGLNVGTSSDLASRKLHVVGDIEVSGTIYQSGSIFEGGGGGGSSTFLALTDTPGSFTAGKYLSVNSAGNAVEMVNTIQSGFSTIDQGYFTGLDLIGTAVGIVQYASGSIAGLDLADNKWDVSIIEEFDTTSLAVTSNLLAYYPLNHNAVNASGSAADGTVNGATPTSDRSSRPAHAYSFDGTNDYIDMGVTASAPNAVTVCAWVYSTWSAGGGYRAIVCKGTSASLRNYTLQISSTGKLDANFQPCVTPCWKGLSSTDDLPLNQWVHTALTIAENGSNVDMILYINGSANGNTTFNSTSLDGLSAGNLAIGRDGASAGGYWPGSIDEVLIYDRALSASEITQVYNDAPVIESKYVGQVGGWDDSVDYGIKKISSTELSVRKMSTDVPDRLYVNVQKLGAIGQGIVFDQVYTGDGVTTNYLLTDDVPSARDVLVAVQGFVQTPTIDYTLAGTTGVSFTTAVTSGDEISLRYLALGPSGADGAVGADGTGVGVSFSNIFTGDGLVSGFAVESSVPEAKDLLVTLNGIIQRPTADYTLVGNTGVYFDSALTSGFNLEARYLSMGGTGAPGPAGSAASFAKDVFTGDGVVSGFTMGRSVSNILETTVFLNGLAQFPDDNYFVNGTSLTFADGDIASGDLIMVRHVY